jgi:DNA replication protein DnaC
MITPEEMRAVACGKMECPYCKGLEFLVEKDSVTGIEYALDCYCYPYKRYWERVMLLPEKIRFATLSELTPSDKSAMPIEKQKKLYAKLVADPYIGYAFFGPPGWSKTTVCTALYKEALFDRIVRNPIPDIAVRHSRIGVWRIVAPVLIAQCQEKFKEGAPRPDLTVKMITSLAPIRPCLFIEEIDKFHVTEYAQAELFQIINALDEANGQLVINCNLTKKDFENQFGGPIARRVKEMCKTYDFHPK